MNLRKPDMITVIYAGVGFVVIILVVNIVILWVSGLRKNTTSVPPPPAHTSSIISTSGRPVGKTLTDSVINYWLYGKVVEIRSEDAKGLHVIFRFDGDTVGVNIPVLIKWADWYILREYDGDFGPQYLINRVASVDFRREIMTAPLVELNIQILRNDRKKTTLELMDQLEAANRGQWALVPTRELFAQSAGIVK